MIKFLTQPKSFTTPTGKQFNIDAISIVVKSCAISKEEKVGLIFYFYEKKLENNETVFIENCSFEADINKKVIINQQGDSIDLISSLFSYDKIKVYTAANLFAIKNDYQLLPIDQQSYL